MGAGFTLGAEGWRRFRARLLDAPHDPRLSEPGAITRASAELRLEEAPIFRRLFAARVAEPGFPSDAQTPHRVSPGLMQTLIATAREALGDPSLDRAPARSAHLGPGGGGVFPAAGGLGAAAHRLRSAAGHRRRQCGQPARGGESLGPGADAARRRKLSRRCVLRLPGRCAGGAARRPARGGDAEPQRPASMRASSPSRICDGVGGQPGISRSTGTAWATPPSTA